MSPDDVVDPAARLSYAGALLPAEVPPAPLGVLARWYADAQADERVAEPGAMVVATAGADGFPDARTVLLKGLSADGLTFFTNLESAKARQLAQNPRAACVLLWHPMYRQVRVRGRVVEVSREEAERYFQSRPRGSQVAAWASRQSAPVGSRADVEAAYAAVDERFAGVEALPLPDFWGGYRVVPDDVEVWVGQENRLHDRIAWVRVGEGGLDDPAAWRVERRQP